MNTHRTPPAASVPRKNKASVCIGIVRACFGIGWGLRRPLLADPAGADRGPYRGVRTRSATNRAAKSGRPEVMRREGRLMRRKARRYSPISASLYLLSCGLRSATQPPIEFRNRLLGRHRLGIVSVPVLLGQIGEQHFPHERRALRFAD